MNDSFNMVNGGSVVPAVVPADYGAAAVDGAYISLRDVVSAEVFGHFAGGVAGNGPILEMKQATSAAGAGEAVLPMTEIWTKVGAGDWTRVAGVDRTNPVNTFDTDTVGGDDEALQFLIRVHEGTLDSGFSHVKFECAAAGGNRLASVTYLSRQRLYAGSGTPQMA
jgi:hypothetical protein